MILMVVVLVEVEVGLIKVVTNYVVSHFLWDEQCKNPETSRSLLLIVIKTCLTSADIAQLGERKTEDLKVPGSIPGVGIFLLLGIKQIRRINSHHHQ